MIFPPSDIAALSSQVAVLLVSASCVGNLAAYSIIAVVREIVAYLRGEARS